MELDWMDDLEARVHEAAERLSELKQKNAELETQVADLEAQLAAATAPGAEGPPAAWEGERDAIRRRVEKLAATLEDLLEE